MPCRRLRLQAVWSKQPLKIADRQLPLGHSDVLGHRGLEGDLLHHRSLRFVQLQHPRWCACHSKPDREPNTGPHARPDHGAHDRRADAGADSRAHHQGADALSHDSAHDRQADASAKRRAEREAHLGADEEPGYGRTDTEPNGRPHRRAVQPSDQKADTLPHSEAHDGAVRAHVGAHQAADVLGLATVGGRAVRAQRRVHWPRARQEARVENRTFVGALGRFWSTDLRDPVSQKTRARTLQYHTPRLCAPDSGTGAPPPLRFPLPFFFCSSPKFRVHVRVVTTLWH